MKRTKLLVILISSLLASVGVHDTTANDLEQCGYQSLPIVMEQMPDGTIEFEHNNLGMQTFNDYLDDMYMWTPSNGSVGWNLDNEFGGYPTNQQLDDTWGFSWGDAIAMALTFTPWCTCCRIEEADIVFNPDRDWSWDRDQAEIDSTKTYYPSVLLHEIAHTWGMQRPSSVEDYAYEHPTVMFRYVTGIVQDFMTIHVPEVSLMREAYRSEEIRNMVVTSKYAHPTTLTWSNSTTEQFPVLTGEYISVRDLTVENTGTVDLVDVNLRLYIEDVGRSSEYLIGEYEWDVFPAESYGVFTYYLNQVPMSVETGTYRVTAHVTHNESEEDDRPGDSYTHLVDTVEILKREIDVTSPALHNELTVGQIHPITWTSENIGDKVTIEYMDISSGQWFLVGEDIPNTGTYDWLVPGPELIAARIKVTGDGYHDGVAALSGSFSIVGRYLELEQPNGGELLNPGSYYDIRWVSDNIDGEIELSYNCTGSYNPIVAGSVPNSGFYDWQVPDVISNSCVVNVKSADDPTISDTSSGYFAIAGAGIDVTSPQQGDAWYVGDLGQVEFDFDGACTIAGFAISRDGGSSWDSLGTDFSDESPFLWVIEGPDTDQAIFRVSDACDPDSFAYSGTFSIRTRSIELLSPNGGGQWQVGERYFITWESVGAGDDVALLFERDLGSTYLDFIELYAPNTGVYQFTVPPEYAGVNASVQVRSNSVGGLHDRSDTFFWVIDPRVTVTSPNGGEVVVAGEPRDLTWTSSDAGSLVRIDQQISGGSWKTIVGQTPNDGTYRWMMPDLRSGTEVVIKVTSVEYPDASDVSDASFTVSQRNLEVTSPSGGESFEPGRMVRIRWTEELAGRGVAIAESCDRGATWAITAADTPNDGEFSVVVAPPRRTDCRIRVSSVQYPDVFALSEGVYEVENSPPSAFNDAFETTEDHQIEVPVTSNDGDLDGDSLTVIAFTQPDNGRVETDGGRLTYQPRSNYHGPDSFGYTVSDGYGGEDSALVGINVTSVNDDPVAVDDEVEMWQDTEVTIRVLLNDFDVDGDSLTLIAMSSALHGSASYANNRITYTPAPGYTGPDTIGYSIMDDHGDTADATVHITVVGVLFADDFEDGTSGAWSVVSP